MFDIAWTEILVVATIAIIVVGPKELPGMLRAFGKTFGQIRRMSREFQSTFNDALREAERETKLDEFKKDFSDMGKFDPAADVRKSLDETKRSLNEGVTDKPATTPQKTASAPPAKPAATNDHESAEPMDSPVPPMDSEPPRAAAGGER